MARKKKEVKVPGINKDGTIDKRYSKRKPLPTTADGFAQNKVMLSQTNPNLYRALKEVVMLLLKNAPESEALILLDLCKETENLVKEGRVLMKKWENL